MIAAVPIPQVPAQPPVPAYIGAPAPARPVRGVPPTPRNPFMAPNGTSEIHGDAWQTDAYSWSGPAGRSPVTFSTLLSRDCATITFDTPGQRSSADDLPSSWRATISSWICWVPSNRSRILASRAHFSSSSPSP